MEIMTSTNKLVTPTPAGIAQAVAALQAGLPIGLPTETVYGLAADAGNGEALARIFDAKQRPRFNPLICHILGLREAEEIGVFNTPARQLAARFWPGPLTLVVPRRADAAIHDLATAGLDSIALRAPAHPVARQVLAAFGKPVAAPSANRSGRLSPTRAAHVLADLGQAVALILDGGPCAVGLESTVVEPTGDALYVLRPGTVTDAMLAEATGLPVKPATGAIKSPGQLASHYAPTAPVRLNAQQPAAGEAMLGFGPVAGDVNLSPTGDLVEAAANLFAMLHALDERRPAAIAIAPIPQEGLGKAINDRLMRAAQPRNDTA